MNRHDLAELHSIVPIANMSSVMSMGLLSHSRAAKIEHRSVASEEIQRRRVGKRVSGGRLLHDYVNLYFHARNPMMYVTKHMHEELCVVSVATDVLDLPGTIVTDCNAATDYARFAPAPAGLAIVDRAATFAEFWTDDDAYEYLRKKRAKQAEVLVEDGISVCYIRGAYVSCPEARDALQANAASCKVRIKPTLFFL